MGVFIDNPLVVLFLVVAVGAAVGSVRVRGISLGPAAALFVGLGVSAYDERLGNTPAIVPQIGLALFIYTVGLASGPSFLAGLRRGGVKVLAGAAAVIGSVALLVLAAASLLDLDVGARAGLFAGVLTNTPALSAAIEGLGGKIAAGTVTDPVVGYSLAYPLGVLCMLLAADRVLRRARRAVPTVPAGLQPPVVAAATSATVLVTRADLPQLGDLRRWEGCSLAFSRVEHDGVVHIATTATRLVPGDRCTFIGAPEEVERFIEWAGERSNRHLALDRSRLDFRRIAVSNRALAGKRLADLDLEANFGVAVTRLRRGDTDVVADGEMTLRLGDRVRVVGTASGLASVAALFGDSDRGLSEVDALGFAFGLAAGLLIGLVAVPLPGGGSLELGVGGGPLLAGLFLGTLSRTGPITWQVPHAANLTLRQLGMLMFLGSVGIRSGHAFQAAAGTAIGARLAAAAAVIGILTAMLSLLVLRLLRADPIASAGHIAGIETQPAVQAYAAEATKGDPRVDAGYALVLPLAMIAKLILVQLLL